MKEGSSSLGQLRIGNCKGYSGNWTGVLLGTMAMMMMTTMITTMAMMRMTKTTMMRRMVTTTLIMIKDDFYADKSDCWNEIFW